MVKRLRARAIAWLRRAAELAAARYAADEAFALLERALALEPDREARIAILCQKGAVHMAAYDVEGFRDSMEEALALGPTRAVAADIYGQLAHYGLGRPYMWKQAPGSRGHQWLSKALELSEPASEARGYALLARALSDPSAGAEDATEAHAIAEALGRQRLIVYTSEAQAHAATEARRYQEARQWADGALQATRDLSDPGLVGHQYWNAGFVYLRAGRIADVRRFADIYDGLARSLSPHDQVHVIALYALLESVLGRWDALAELSGKADAATAANDDSLASSTGERSLSARSVWPPARTAPRRGGSRSGAVSWRS
jgi:tetratricopeptide (TPR) repeat protein